MFRPKFSVFFVIAFISLLNSKLISQVSNPITSEPGISVDHLTFIDANKATQIPFTGDLNFSIPILTIPGRNGLDFPVHLNYNGRIRSKQKATWVGLGFNLQVGSVTRNVVKRVDEQQESMFNGTTSYNFNLGVVNGSADHVDEATGIMLGSIADYEEWDNYNVILPDGGSRIKPIFDDQGIVKFESEDRKAWRIYYNIINNNVNYNQNLDDFIPNFGITKEDGTDYIFNHQSTVITIH